MPTNYYEGASIYPSDIAGLMRRINALQSAVDVKTIARFPRNASQYEYPGFNGVALGAGGIIYASNNIQCVRFNSDLEATGAFSQSGYDDYGDMCVDSDGNIYVLADNASNDANVLKFDSSLAFVDSWGASSFQTSSTGLAINSSDLLYVAKLGTVDVYQSDGTLDGTITTTGCGPKIAIDSSGNFYISKIDAAGGLYPKISKRNGMGEIASFGGYGGGDGEFYNVQCLCVDAQGTIYAFDQGDISLGTNGGRLQRITSAGAFEDKYGISTGYVQGFLLQIAHDGSQLFAASLGDDAGSVFIIGDQTKWYAYELETKSSMGTPDGGVSVPDNSSIGATLSPEYVGDMRVAIEGLTVRYTNAITGDPFVWTATASGNNLYSVSMGDRTDYGATGGNKYDWTRQEVAMGGGMVVAGTDGNAYKCRLSHTAAAANKPITGANYADYWALASSSGATWTTGRKYNAPGTTYTAAKAVDSQSIVDGTDSKSYICTTDHRSGSSNRPITGVDYADYWEELLPTAIGHTWQTNQTYHVNLPYDIDLGEIRACVEVLESSTPL